MSEHEEKDQERTEQPEAAEAVEDLDVPEEDSQDVKGGIMNAWPKKYDGG